MLPPYCKFNIYIFSTYQLLLHWTGTHSCAIRSTEKLMRNKSFLTCILIDRSCAKTFKSCGWPCLAWTKTIFLDLFSRPVNSDAAPSPTAHQSKRWREQHLRFVIVLLDIGDSWHRSHRPTNLEDNDNMKKFMSWQVVSICKNKAHLQHARLAFYAGRRGLIDMSPRRLLTFFVQRR